MKKKTATQKPFDLIQKFSFQLTGHLKISRPDNEHRKSCSHVTSDIYRLPEVKFQTAPAEPLDHEEDVRRAFLAYCSPAQEENVVTASADAEKALGTLAGMARDGNGKALWQFAELVKKAVEGLNQIATNNPGAVKPFAKQCDRWPMRRSTAPHLCDDDALLEKIELGKSAGVQLDKFSRWKPDYAAAVAAELIRHIEFMRHENQVCLDAGRKIEFSKFVPRSAKTVRRIGGLSRKSFYSPLIPSRKKSPNSTR